VLQILPPQPDLILWMRISAAYAKGRPITGRGASRSAASQLPFVGMLCLYCQFCVYGRASDHIICEAHPQYGHRHHAQPRSRTSTLLLQEMESEYVHLVDWRYGDRQVTVRMTVGWQVGCT